MNTVENKDLPKVNSKKLLKTLASENRKIKFNDRINLEVVKETRFYKKGQLISPHRTFGEELIKQKIAKEI